MILKRDLKSGYRPKIENFKGSYIGNIPEIRSTPLTDKTKGLLLASDGLWDELSNEEITRLFDANRNNTDKFLKESLERALDIASQNSGITSAQLKKIEVGRRRALHDDITMLYVDLKNYVNKDG